VLLRAPADRQRLELQNGAMVTPASKAGAGVTREVSGLHTAGRDLPPGCCAA